MKTLQHYILIYREYLKNCIAEALSYRLHFVLLIIMDIFFYLSILGSVEFLFLHISTIGPWNRNDFMFFMAFMIAVEHLHMTFISENFWEFSFDIRTGQLDYVLLKPINSIFVVFFRSIRIGTLLNGVFPWGFLIYFGLRIGLLWWQWILLPPLVLLGLAFLTSIEILMSLSMFWIVESMGVNFVRMQLQKISRWPDFIYQYYAQKLFMFVVPVLLVGSAPVRFLKDPLDWSGLFWLLLLMMIIWVLIGVFWQKGLNAYESASS